MSYINISAVSYLNAKPFIYGLENAKLLDTFHLEEDIPSVCAQKLISGEVQIGLVPVAILPELPEYYIISDYCIGATKSVSSVMLFSKVPIKQIECVLLDYQSRTSVQLMKILAKHSWKIEPHWSKTESGFENKIENTTAAVIIGDRALEMRGTFPYEYDLAEAWVKMTGLPFVFACWVSVKPLSKEFLTVFNMSLEYGLEHRGEVVNTYLSQSKLTSSQLYEYLYESISYDLDEQKRKGLDSFLEYLAQL